jgi:hypothetical protein
MSEKDQELNNARWMVEQVEKAKELAEWRQQQEERLAIICAANDTERKIKEAEERGAREMAEIAAHENLRGIWSAGDFAEEVENYMQLWKERRGKNNVL